MPALNEKSKKTFEISYENYFKTRFNGIIEIMRAFSPIIGKKHVLEKLTKLSEKRSVKMIENQLENLKPITNFEEFKEIYKEQISTDFMQHCSSFVIVEDTPKKLSLKFTECLWANTFLEVNASDIGYSMCCYPDFAMAKAYHPNIKLIRTKTLMQGNDYCNHTYIWED
jgi:hypothetical protein